MRAGLNLERCTQAFRNASGTVVLQAPLDLGSRALTGQSLAAVRHDCHVYKNSTLDYSMADSACREWNQSPYAFPNNSIYALTHMEYHNESNQACPRPSPLAWTCAALLAANCKRCARESVTGKLWQRDLLFINTDGARRSLL